MTRKHYDFTPKLKFSIEVCGECIKVFDTSHSIQRFFQRFDGPDVDDTSVRKAEFGIYSMIVSMGDTILDAKDGEIFGVYDSTTQIGLIVQLTNEFGVQQSEIHLDIITVCKTAKFFVRQGQRMFEVEELLSSNKDHN